MRHHKLLFVAMSGVRVQNQALLERGLTLPGFVERSQVIASLPSLGLLTLAAHTPPHWEVEYREIDELLLSEPERISEGGYDVVAISSLTARINDAYRLADALRARGVTVVLGGLHASAMPEEAALHADIVVQGEGENLWPQILLDIENGQQAPFYSSFDTAGAPYSFHQSRTPRYDLLDIGKYNRLTLQTTRGCPLDCEFCGASRMISSYKIKPLEQVQRDLEAILSLWPRPFIELTDDNTFANKKWARGLAELLGEYDIPWFTETDISVADDDELLSLLAQSNCAQLLIGLESTEADSLFGVDGRHWKHSQISSYRDKIAKIQSYGIAVNGCFILGFDQDDLGVFERTRDFVLGSELADVQITLLTPFPGTALHRRLQSKGRLLEPAYWDKCTLFDVTFQPHQMSVSQLEERFALLMSEIYAPEATAQRKRNFRNCVRARHERLSPAQAPEQ
jgi:radical SAM superfamily enzyme YgiQ (UPF0313 family)